jgi:predicted PurR-regulated permease PerM
MTNENAMPTRPRTIFLFMLAVAVSLLFLWVIKGFVLALVLAAVLAAVAYPLYEWLTKRLRGRESAASMLTVLLFLVVIVGPGLLFLGVLMRDAMAVSEKVEPWIAEMSRDPGALRQAIEETPALQELLPYQDRIVEKAAQFAGKAASWVAQAVVGSATGAAAFFFKMFIALFAMFHFLKDGRAILDWVFAHMPITREERERLLTTFSSVSRATLKGTLVIGVVQGGLAGAAFAVAGIEGYVFWGVVMTILSIIPGVGTALVWVPAVAYLGLTGQVGAAIGLAAWCALVVGTADNFLRPVLVGKDTKMSDLMVLLTTMGGLTLFGAAGIVIGPVIGALFTTVWTLWRAAVEERGS